MIATQLVFAIQTAQVYDHEQYNHWSQMTVVVGRCDFLGVNGLPLSS